MDIDNLFHSEFRKRIAEKREGVVNNLVAGAPEDFSEYKYYVGYARAIEDLSREFEEVLKALFD